VWVHARAQEATAKIDEYARGMISGSGSTLFEELGLYYIGPIDGHNLDLLITMLQGARSPLYFAARTRSSDSGVLLGGVPALPPCCRARALPCAAHPFFPYVLQIPGTVHASSSPVLSMQ
jgi:hypothetical protein